jgi:Protein of unknown function (DUF3486)
VKKGFFDSLPAEDIALVNQILIDGKFQNYTELVERLGESGLHIGRSALAKYGRSFEDRLSALRLSHDFALAYKKALPDEAGARSELLTDLAQDVLFNLMLQLQNRASQLEDDAEGGELTSLSTLLSKVTRAIGDINRSSVTVKRYAADVRTKQEAKFNELNADGVKRGIDAEFMQRLKTEVLGLV